MSSVVTRDDSDVADAVRYSVIYMIHADDDYLYHNSDGRPVQANEETFLSAIQAAEEAASGEVFIFHQQPQRKFLGLIPRRNSEMVHYRNGRQINHVTYRHSKADTAMFATETELFNQAVSGQNGESRQKYLFYFGHEIPEAGGTGYHKSRRNVPVNTELFAKGVQGFLSNNPDRFDLIILSTCSNGTPAMARHLHPFTDYLLASPQNLHLSFMDTEAVGILENHPSPSPKQLGGEIAGQTFERLSGTLQTTITLALYDLNVVSRYIGELYDRNSEYEKSTDSNPFLDKVDCAELPFFDGTGFHQGIEIFYQPSKFGRQAASLTHSGWGCRAP